MIETQNACYLSFRQEKRMEGIVIAHNFFLSHIKLRHNMERIKIPVIPKILFWFDRFIFSCDIPNKVIIGEDVVFPHYGLGCIFHERTVIGNHCRIYQHVTIGCRNGIGPPIIGDYVLIGAGAILLGAIKIGNNVCIGAGAVVVHDIPDNCTVVGNPASIIKTNKEFLGSPNEPK